MGHIIDGADLDSALEYTNSQAGSQEEHA
jgi:hypothetical protein